MTRGDNAAHAQSEVGSSPILRQATPDDFPAVQEVARTTWQATYQGMLSRRSIERFLQSAYSDEALWRTQEHGGLWVLEHQGRIIGYLRLSTRNKVGYIGAIYLLPAFQGQGFGRLLWEGALRWFVARGVEQVRLSVAAENKKARAFYRHLGLEEMSTSLTEIDRDTIEEVSCRYDLLHQRS